MLSERWVVVVAVGDGVPRSHAELVAALSAYAAGTVRGRGEEAVRRHLAGGCRDCLDALFSYPVGLPRGPSPHAPSSEGAWPVVTAVLVVIALTGTVLASTMWLGGRLRSVAPHALGSGKVAALASRAAVVRATLTSVGARSRRLEAELASLARATGETVGAERPSRNDERRAQALARLGSALTSPATRLERLPGDGRGGGIRGWVAWDPLPGRLFVYVIGLPRLVTPWEARVQIGDAVRRVPLERLGDGGLWAAIEPHQGGGCTAALSIVPPGAERVVLAGTLRLCDGSPAA